MIFNLKLLVSKRKLQNLDKELAKIQYNELLGGLQELEAEIINDEPELAHVEEMRVLYAIKQCCLELQKIYGEGN